jgi:DNA topoisomerase-6 subunit B
MTIRGKYTKGKQSPYDYIRGVAIVNPHARITFAEPDDTKTIFERISDKIPPVCKEIKPHPEGIELGTLLNMAKGTDSYRISAFLVNEFSRISYRVAHEICEKAGISEDMKPKNITIDDAKKIIDAIKEVRIMAPPTDCLSPIGERLIKKGLRNVLGSLKPEFYVPPVTRDPKVHTGNPFIVEVGMVYGGDLPKDQPIQILRFANRVPLLYQQGACATSIAVENIDWRRYGMTQPAGKGIPVGPLVVLIHVASTKVPFTSESKEAIADLPEIQEEIEKALRESARKLQIHINKEIRRKKTSEKFTIVQKVLPQIAAKSASILNKPVPVLDPVITKIMDVVWIDWTSEFVPKPPRHKVTVSIYNYTAKPKKMNFYAVVPPNTIIEKTVSPAPTLVKEASKLEWELKAIPSVQKQEILMELQGLDKDEFDDMEIYVSGIDPAHVIGAQALPGDWNLEGMPETVDGGDTDDDEETEPGEKELGDVADDDDAKACKGGASNED